MSKKRSSRPPGLVLVLLVAIVLAGWGCGSQSESEAAATSDDGAVAVLTADFEGCELTERDVGFSAGGWSGSVAGEISCDEAGELIQDHLNRDFGQNGLLGSDADSIRESDPGRYSSAGFDCATFPLPDGMGWHVLCGLSEAQVSFYLTP